MKPCVAIVTIIIGFTSCQHSATMGCQVEDFGYHESYLGRSVVEQAVRKANAVLDPALALSFAPSWDIIHSSGRSIKVFLVDSDDLSATDLARSPGSLDCLFLSSAFSQTIKLLFGEEGSGTLEVDQADVLAIILLHEAGHFRFGDAGEYGSPVAVTSDSLPLELSEDKNKELRADRF